MISNIAVISDGHAGSQLALCPPRRFKLDGGGYYEPSPVQRLLHRYWKEYWEWVKNASSGEPFAVVNNGDALDGIPHDSKGAISYNFADQEEIAYQLLSPIVEMCQGRYYHIRGTEAHVGKSAENEEKLARRLGAIPDGNGNFARNELWLSFGRGNTRRLAHFLHHVGTASRTAYETSAVMAELSELFTESGRWGDIVPDVVVRSHRHRNIAVRIPTRHGYGIAFTTPAWQLKTPFAYKVAGARTTTPQIGGSFIRVGDEDIFDRHRVWNIPRPKREVAK